jgi:hypothetical protein
LDFAYPRPQLQRSDWISLNGPWRFCFDDDRAYSHPSAIEQWPLTITVPFAPGSRSQRLGDRGFHRVCWYERSFELEAASGRTLLRFGAVDYAARCGSMGSCGGARGRPHAFSADITDLLDASGGSRRSPSRSRTTRMI